MASSRLLSVFLFGILSSCVFSADIPDEIGVTWVKSEPTGLYFSKYETTVAQYQACLRAGACDASNYDENKTTCNIRSMQKADYPMNCVKFDGAVEFCDWLGARLPTEDEWYAEASNNGTRLYTWGDAPEASCSYCVMDEDVEDRTKDGCGTDSTLPVGSKPNGDSVSGISDMCGSVAELTATESPPNIDGDPWITRGGSWFSSSEDVETTAWSTGGSASHGVGFRCVADTRP